ncbi:MAG: CAP domain-containing protein [Patescibacteria group bacterium]
MEKLIHLLLPRQSNNHKAKILHPSSLIVVTLLLIAFQGIINYVSKVNPDILGYASSIGIQEVVNLTNQKRSEAGLSALSLNQELSAAAYTKGRDMIDKDYWAHVAPDGTQPWKFFNDFGYKYKYAGENLARDFSSASAAVDAWMNSPTHKDNILNPKYKEIGIGVVEGDLAGSDTTVIVQFFGATYADRPQQPLADKAVQTEVDTKIEPVIDITPSVIANEVKQSPTPIATLPAVPRNDMYLSNPTQQVLVSPFTTTRNISISVVVLLLIVFMVDAFLVSKRRITRVAGRTLAHVVFLGMILSIIMIIKSGNIL